MKGVDRLSPDCHQGPNQVSFRLLRERERKVDAPAAIDHLWQKHAGEFEHPKPALDGLAVAERMPRRGSSQFPTISETLSACGFGAKHAGNHPADYWHPSRMAKVPCRKRVWVQGL